MKQNQNTMAATPLAGKVDALFKMKLPSFDARVLVLPNDDEVVNYFIWRQQDAERNSIQALAQSMFSHGQLHKKDTSAMQDMMHEKGVNWNDCPTRQKRGVAVVKRQVPKLAGSPPVEVMRSAWVIDNEMPILTKDKEYVYSLLPVRNDYSRRLLPEKDWWEIMNQPNDTAKPNA